MLTPSGPGDIDMQSLWWSGVEWSVPPSGEREEHRNTWLLYY